MARRISEALKCASCARKVNGKTAANGREEVGRFVVSDHTDTYALYFNLQLNSFISDSKAIIAAIISSKLGTPPKSIACIDS